MNADFMLSCERQDYNDLMRARYERVLALGLKGYEVRDAYDILDTDVLVSRFKANWEESFDLCMNNGLTPRPSKVAMNYIAKLYDYLHD